MRCDCCDAEEEWLKKAGDFDWYFCSDCYADFSSRDVKHTRIKYCKCCGRSRAKEKFQITSLADSIIRLMQLCMECDTKENKVIKCRTLLTDTIHKLNQKYLTMKF